MASVHDVAAYILEKLGELTTMKLQKLVYYSQAWSLIWDEEPMFENDIEAWSNGPVIRELYNKHKGFFKVSKWRWGNSSNLSRKQKNTINAVLNFYGNKSSQWLSDLTHMEKPWKDARKGLAPGEPGYKRITLSCMMEYYSSL